MEENIAEEFVELRIGATIYKTKLNKMFNNRKPYRIPDNRNLYSFIPGTIVEVNVKVGKKVKEGDILLLLEAMKMKNQVLAPFDGKIKTLTVKVGQIVPKDFLLIEMEK